MKKTDQKYNNLLVHENIFLNVFSQNPKILALALLIKAEYGSSVVYGESFEHIAGKLKINVKTLIDCLHSPISKTIFSIKKKNDGKGGKIIYVKAGKLYAGGKNIKFELFGDEYFDARHMRIGIGQKVTIKTITDKLYVLKSVLCAHKQGNAIHATYGTMKSKSSSQEEGANREEETPSEPPSADKLTWTGCSLETFSRKLQTSKYKTIKVLKDAVRLGAITKRTRKVVYQGRPTDAGGSISIREGGKFTIIHENGRVMEQLSNEYRTVHIKFNRLIHKKGTITLKDGTKIKADELKKRRAGSKCGLKKFCIPRKPELMEEAVWRSEEGLTPPDLVNGHIVQCETAPGLPSYIRTDLIKEHIKSLRKSRNPERKALAKEMLQSFHDDEVMVPYRKETDKSGKIRYIKMLEGIYRNANDYTFSKWKIHKTEYIDASVEKYMTGGTYSIYEVVSFILEVKKYQKKINRNLNESKKRGEANPNEPMFIMNDNLISAMIREMNKGEGLLEKVSKPSRAIFEEFIEKGKRARDGKRKDIEITMEAVWKYLACTGVLGKYIYDKKMDLEEGSSITELRGYMTMEAKMGVDRVIGVFG